MTKGSDLIAAERDRQVTEEGWSAEHDAGHALDLIQAGDAYAAEVNRYLTEGDAPKRPGWWPWADEFWKPTGDPVRDLVKAGALIAAAIDALEAER